MSSKRLLFPLVFILSIILAACASPAAPAAEPTPVPPTAVPTPAPDPIAVVQAYYAALNAGDLPAIETFLDERVVSTSASGLVEGKEKVLANLQVGLGSGYRFELSDLVDDAGRVTSCYTVFQKETWIAEGCDGVTIVHNGLVLFDGVARFETNFVVERFYQALNDRDLDLAMFFVADDAVFSDSRGTFTGKAEIRAALEQMLEEGLTFSLSKLHNFQGSVDYTYEVSAGDAVVESGTDGLTIVENGRIVFDGTQQTASATE